MTDTPLRFAGAAASHSGLVRSHNEDSAFAGPGLLLVADGVGGHACGEVASSLAAHVVPSTFDQRRTRDPLATMREAVARAQQRVADEATGPGRAGMATTLTAVATDGHRFALAHLGDSRVYVLHGGELRRVSRDHTVVQQMVDDGALAPEQVRGHPWSHVVTRVLGGDLQEPGDVVGLALGAGDRLLLCSDGLSDLVDDDRLRHLLTTHDDAGAVDALVAEALAAGGRDNVTAIVATVVPGVPEAGGQLVGAAALEPRSAPRSA